MLDITQVEFFTDEELLYLMYYPPQMIDTGVDKYVDGEPIFLTGSLNAGDELIIVLQRYNYNASGIDSNIDFLVRSFCQQ